MVASVHPPRAGGEARPVPDGSLRLQILGPLRLWRDGVELDAGPPQQAYLLVLLLARAGRVISMSELIDLVWDDDPPASAVNVIHKYIGALRRLLEPALTPRGASSFLQRRGEGYLFLAGPGVLDLVTFRGLVEAAEIALAEQRPEPALDRYVEALGLWHGPAGDGLSSGPTAMSIFTALDGEFFDACVAAAELAVSLGRPERVLLPLRLAAEMAPLHEPVQASLVLMLAAAGQPAAALLVWETVRSRLADELGVDPGPVLQTAHQRVLSRPPTAVVVADEVGDKQVEAAGGLVGRTEDLAVLRQAVGSALAGGTGLVVVEGEPGVGKTRLLEELAAEAGRLGVLVVWGRCLEGDGAPSMWPWVQALEVLLEGLHASSRESLLASDLGRLVEPSGGFPAVPAMPDGGAQFRLFQQVVAVVGTVSTRRPAVLIVDDLQWADVASLQLFGHLAARLPAGATLIGALRDRTPAPGPELARTLAAVSRVPDHRRIRLGPLGPAEVAELVRRETGHAPRSGVARSMHARTSGNPFFVRELLRFLSDGGALTEDAVASAGVPSTVRDVVLDRLTGLDDDARGLLQLAALVGRDVDLGVLAGAADLDIGTCLDRLEPADALNLLEPVPGDPSSVRFAHDLVRESVVGTVSRLRAARPHLHIADALERTDPGGEHIAERLAHHLWAAGPLAGPARTADALVRAGRCAATKSAFEAAERHLRSATQLARTAGLAELELSALTQLTAVVAMRSGHVGSALDLLERAEQLARGLGRELEATDFLYARWAAHSQGIQLDRSALLARRLLDHGEASSDPIMRAYGLHAWGIHQWDVGNIGEAFRYLSRSNRTMVDDLARREEDPLRHSQQLLSPVMLAQMTALHGDVAAARALLDTVEAAAADDPYKVTVWATFASTIGALAGDPAWALYAAERGIAVDPELSFVFFGTYLRLNRCWARAVAGEDPAGAAAQAQEIIAQMPLNPPRSGMATWYGLLGEMRMAAAMPVEAGVALDRADGFLSTYGQRYAEGLLLLLRARQLQARGAPVAVVRAAAERARTLSVEREAHLFAHRADSFLAELADLR